MKHPISPHLLLSIALTLSAGAYHPCTAESPDRISTGSDLLHTEWEIEIGKGLVTPPEVDEGHVLALSTDGWAALVDCRRGGTIWRRKAGYGFISRGVVIEDAVYVVSQGDKRFLAAVSLKTGETLWRTGCGRISSGPVRAGGSLVILESSGFLKCYDRSSSDLKWTVETGVPCLEELFTTGEAIFASCADTIFVFDSVTGARTSTLQFEDAEAFHTVSDGNAVLAVKRDGAASLLRTDTGEVLWSIRFLPAASYFVTVGEGSDVACIAAGEYLNVIELETGRPLWKYRLPSPAAGPAVLTDNLLAVTTIHGGLYIQDVRSGKLLGSTELGRPLGSSPVMDSGRIYVATQFGTLICMSLDEDGLPRPTGIGGGS